MRYTVVIDAKAAREIRVVPRQDQVRIVAKIEALADNPRPSGCTKMAGDVHLWRIRSGNYRILYQIQDRQLIVTVVKVGHRREVYRSK